MPSPTRNLTILLTDIKGFTDKTSHKTRADIMAMLDKHKEIVLPILTSKGGILVKTIGDAFLMTFESPTDAVLAGIVVQDALFSYNADKSEDDRIEVRIAINSGEVNLADNDVFGEPVNIAARIEAITEAGQVFFTEAVYLAMNKTEVPSSEVGLLQLKGIPEKVRVYKVRREEPVGGASSAARPSSAAAFRPGEKARLLPQPSAVPLANVVGSKPKLSRRAAAALIDVALCAVLISVFGPGDRTEVRIKKDSGRGLQAAQPQAGDSKTSANVSIDESGIRLNNGWTARAVTKKKPFPLFALVWFIYSLMFLKWIGTTPGGRICKLGVVQSNGAPTEKRQRMVRAIFSVVSAYCFGLGFLWALWEKDGRGWHDLMAGTRVVAVE